MGSKTEYLVKNLLQKIVRELNFPELAQRDVKLENQNGVYLVHGWASSGEDVRAMFTCMRSLVAGSSGRAVRGVGLRAFVC